MKTGGESVGLSLKSGGDSVGLSLKHGGDSVRLSLKPGADSVGLSLKPGKLVCCDLIAFFRQFDDLVHCLLLAMK